MIIKIQKIRFGKVGKPRTIYTLKCNYCKKRFKRSGKRMIRTKYKIRHYCSCDCASKARRVKRYAIRCRVCKKIYYSKKKVGITGKPRICSWKCLSVGRRKEVGIVKVKTYTAFSYRNKALRFYGTFCRICRYKKLVRMLDVHHIDGNRHHDSVKNLIVLCVWCHALVTRKIIKVSKSEWRNWQTHKT